MAYVLLIIIYIAFIGLGIPDSLLGTAWPAIYLDFALPISYASFISVIISLGTILSSILSARVISRFGTNIHFYCLSLCRFGKGCMAGMMEQWYRRQRR